MSMLRSVLLVVLGLCLVAGPVFADGRGHNNPSDPIVVITHLDIIPPFVPQAQPLIEQFVVDSRTARGVESFIMISWLPTTNHFQLIEVFKNRAAFDAFVSAPTTIAFRNALQPFIGAPYDERLYHEVITHDGKH